MPKAVTVPKERAQASIGRYPSRLTGTIMAPRRAPSAFRATAAWVCLWVSTPMMISASGASAARRASPGGLGPGARAVGQDCDGTSPSSSYQVTPTRSAGAAREVDKSTRGHEVNRKLGQTPRAAPTVSQSSATRPCGSGRSSSARRSPTGSGGGAPGRRQVDLDEVVIKIDGVHYGCGAPWTRRGTCAMCWSRPAR